jgi:pimeloyl-ACP methyl ester carboxylesterase
MTTHLSHTHAARWLAGVSIAMLTACAAPTEPAAGLATRFVASADGTRIAYTRSGSGPPIVLVGGMFSDRRKAQGLVHALEPHFTVFSFDRRGHGESGDNAPYDVKREVEDVAAVAAAAGGRPVVYGHSSGAGLALEYAAGVDLPALVLHEPPYGGDDPQTREQLSQVAAAATALLDQGRNQQAVETFLRSTGMPADAVRQAASDPATVRLAPTMRHDFAVMASGRGSPLPEDKVRALRARTTVLVGSPAPPMFHQTGQRIGRLAPRARYVVLPDQPHAADPAVVAAAIRAAVAA